MVHVFTYVYASVPDVLSAPATITRVASVTALELKSALPAHALDIGFLSVCLFRSAVDLTCCYRMGSLKAILHVST